mgnify:CR=1 FL=1
MNSFSQTTPRVNLLPSLTAAECLLVELEKLAVDVRLHGSHQGHAGLVIEKAHPFYRELIVKADGDGFTYEICQGGRGGPLTRDEVLELCAALLAVA